MTYQVPSSSVHLHLICNCRTAVSLSKTGAVFPLTLSREKYTAIFKDQYVEYQALLREIHARRQRFQELEALMSRLPVRPQSKEEQSRLSAVWRAYRGKKEDPSFLEKQERCDYLRKKLSHLKAQIQTFDADWSEPSVAL
uniref:OCEL domain-containing protein n=1 Tax=Pseudonaja textilis TaxID=8673 RepID=A0A670ZFI4_PSETE